MYFRLTDAEVRSLCEHPKKLEGWFNDNVRRSACLAGALLVSNSYPVGIEDRLRLAICVLMGKSVEYEMTGDGGWESRKER